MIIPKQILAKFYDLEKVNKEDLIYAIDLLSSLINKLDEKINQQTENVERLLEEVIDLKTTFTISEKYYHNMSLSMKIKQRS